MAKRWTRIVFCLDLVTLPLEPLAVVAERDPKARPREDLSLSRSIEATSTDAGEVGALGPQTGVWDPSLAYIGKHRQKQRPRVGDGAGHRRMKGAGAAVSPPRPPLERPPVVFVRGETLEPRQHDQKCESHARALRCSQLSLPTEEIQRRSAWFLHKDDAYNSRNVLYGRQRLHPLLFLYSELINDYTYTAGAFKKLISVISYTGAP